MLASVEQNQEWVCSILSTGLVIRGHLLRLKTALTVCICLGLGNVSDSFSAIVFNCWLGMLV